MAVFQYRAADSSGKVVEGTMEAEGEPRVVSRLHEMGFIPLRVAVPGETASKPLPRSLSLFFRKRVSQQQLLHFTRELSTLLGAGLALDRSLSILANLAETEEFKKTIRSLLEAVRAGKLLSGAMAQHQDVFPKLYVNMIRAGEVGGILDSALRYLVDYLQRSQELKEDTISANMYPSLVVGVSGLSFIFLFLFVIPRLSVFFQDVEEGLPILTRLLIGFSSGLAHYGWILLLLLVAGVGVGVYYIRTAEGRLRWDGLQLRLWLIGDLFRKFEVARFSRTLAALLKGGVPLLEALGTVQGIIGNQHFAAATAAVQTRVREGKGMAGPLAESGLFPPLALHMIAVGEETGKLDAMLADVADHYDREIKRTTKRMTSLLEPIAIVGIGVVLFVVILSLLLGIFSIYDLSL
jgi:general secretion pathway protein F